MPGKHHIEIYDTTLRDGAQMDGITFTVADKLEIIKKLDAQGVQFIEAGWPGANEVDSNVFKEAQFLDLMNATVVAFGMTCHKGKKPDEDKFLPQLLHSGAQIIALVGKSSRFHVERVLETTLEENLRIVQASCEYVLRNNREVFFDAEHYFDGFKEDPEYAFNVLQAAIKGGASRIILCETNGGCLPSEIRQIVNQTRKEFPGTLFGIHTHNDMGLAVANSLAAVECGVVQVQGTINGFGERCGNADLCTVIPILQKKKGMNCVLDQQLPLLTETSRFVAEIANVAQNPFQPFVGSAAFGHKGGMHGQGQGKDQKSYQHINPEVVGNRSKIIISDKAGRANIKLKAKELGVPLESSDIDEVLAEIKAKEAQGYQFDVAIASAELLILKRKAGYRPPFELLYRRGISEKKKNGNPKDESTVRVVTNNHKRKTTYQVGLSKDGMLDSLDKALRRALALQFGKIIRSLKLTDYKVRPVNDVARKGTRSFVRVLISFTSNKRTWTTIGFSVDVVEASCQALLDGFEYAILTSQ